MWKFFRKRRKEPMYKLEVTKEAVPMSTLIRWYCYDLGIEDVNDLVKEFNLMPVSDEGEQYETDESGRRMENIIPLLPFLDMMSRINAKAVSTIQFEDVDASELEGLDTDVMEAIYGQISFAALTAAFSSAIELGLVYRNYESMTIADQDHVEQWMEDKNE